MKSLKSLKELMETIHRLYSGYDDILLLIDMAYEENDGSMVKEINKEIRQFEKKFEELRIQTLLSGEYDPCKYCSYKSVCGYKDGDECNNIDKHDKDAVYRILLGEEEQNGEKLD